MARFSDPEPLGARHELSAFSCNRPSLDRWLIEHARQAEAARSARTYVMTDAQQGGRVVGYYALAAASVEPAVATARAKKGMPRHPIPAALLARLAVDATVQGRGVGAWLLRDAILRVVGAAETLGVRVLLVHAIDDAARAFYERHGFESSPTDPLNLQLLMKDAASAVRDAAG